MFLISWAKPPFKKCFFCQKHFLNGGRAFRYIFFDLVPKDEIKKGCRYYPFRKILLLIEESLRDTKQSIMSIQELLHFDCAQ